MAKNSLNNLSNLPIGTAIKGKWHHNTYKIVKKLGSGANGVVYLTDWKGTQRALKLSDNPVTITSEVNVLKALAKAKGVAFGPALFDVDDWVLGSEKISFYAMEYIEGTDFLTFIKKRGLEWTDVLIMQLLSDLEVLHRGGWIFGDLKPENLIVSGPPIKIRCIDVGGTTKIGRAIKEFTEFFDRGYWGLGSRKAEITYDLFAVAMVMINAYYPKRFVKTGSEGLSQLIEKIHVKEGLKRRKKILLRALKGEYASALEMKRDLSLIKIQKEPISQKVKSSGTPPTRKKRRPLLRALETIIIVSVICFIYAFYIAGQLL